MKTKMWKLVKLKQYNQNGWELSLFGIPCLVFDRFEDARQYLLRDHMEERVE